LEALRDSFLRTVSHELRTPLTSIMGFIDLVLGGGKVEEEQKKYLKIALDEAVNLKVLIDDLLDLSRMEAGRMELVYSTVNVKGLFDNLVSLLSPLARGKNLELVSVVTDEKLETTLDAAKIRRILVNLITNAIKFTEKGTISLRCRLQKKEKEMEFAVSDTGIGLMDDEKEFIFERFRQVDDSSTRKYEGIGLGLSIVKQLVEMHKGRIWVESQYGKGSTFYFAIPL
jgi:signal transduction histidine kinase